MREIRQSGSEGGGGESRSLPLSEEHEHLKGARGLAWGAGLQRVVRTLEDGFRLHRLIDE